MMKSLLLCCVVFGVQLLQLSWSDPIDLCGSAGWNVPSQPSGLTLKQVTAVIRHGDRTQWNGSQCWPGDKSVWNCDLTHLETPKQWFGQTKEGSTVRLFEKIYLDTNEVLNGNCSLAQLTSKGYSQHLANGQSLRSAYIDKAGLLKDPSQVYLRSDDVPRTLQSAESLVLGMFPLPQGSAHFDDAPPPSIPIYTRDGFYDNLVANPLLCPKSGQYSQDFRKSQNWTDHLTKLQSLLEKIKNTTGIELDEDGFDHFSDCLCTHYCHNKTLPKGINDDVIDSVWAENAWQFYTMYKYPSIEENARTGIGFLLKDIWKNLNDTVNGRTDVPKFFLFSGHDTTLMPILVALRVDTGEWPPYASMILVELYQKPKARATGITRASSEQWLVRFVYNGKVLFPPFCDDKGLCDYEKMSTYFATITPPDNYKDSSVCTV